MCGQGHNGDRLQIERLFAFSNSHGGLDTSHDRHAYIHKNHIVSAALRCFNGLLAVVDNIHFVALVLQDLASQLLVNQIVLGEKNMVRNVRVTFAWNGRAAF